MNTSKQLFLTTLIAEHGWHDQDPKREEKYYVTRSIGGGFKGGMMNPKGIRRLCADLTDNKDMTAKFGDHALLTVAYDHSRTFSENVAVFNLTVTALHEATV